MGRDTVHSGRLLQNYLEKLTLSYFRADNGNHLQDHKFYTAQNHN
jgi:hypothetical protein